MTRPALESALACLRRSAEAAPADPQLLDRFLTHADQAAFAMLVRRHGRRVLAACRRVLGHSSEVDDAFQATFLVLLRKARSVRWQPSLAGWLGAVAHRVSVRARDKARRRKRNEEAAAARPSDRLPPDPTWREACDILHEELDRLPDRYRLPLVLCYLEGKSRDEAADQLGWSAGSVKGRLERGRQHLRRRLQRRGVDLSAGLLVVLTGESAEAVPLVLTRAAAGLAEGIPPTAAVRGLAAAAMRTVTATPAALAGGIVIAAGLLGLAAGGGRLSEPTPRAADPAPPTGTKAGTEVRGRVLGPDGKPVAEARLFLCDATGPAPAPQPAADAHGRFRFVVDPSLGGSRLSLLATAPGLGADWTRLETPTADLTLTLPADLPIRGQVVDLEGRPVPGAIIRVTGLVAAVPGKFADYLRDLTEHTLDWRSSHLLDKFLYLGPATDPARVPSTTADAEGRFTLAGLGRDRAAELRVDAPGYANQYVQVALTPDYRPAGPAAGRARLLGPDLTVALAPSKPITGVVRDKTTGKPVPGVRVTGWVENDTSRVSVVATAHADGRYRLDGLPKAAKRLVLTEPGAGAPQLYCYAAVPDTTGFEPVEVNVELHRGVVVTGRVTDQTSGRPVRADVYFGVLLTNPAIRTIPGLFAAGGPTGGEESNHAVTDADGRYRLTVVPGPGVLCVRAWSQDGGRRYARPVVAKEDKDPAFYRADADEFMFYGSRHPIEELSAYRLIRPAVGTADLTADFHLVPGVRRPGRLVDAENKPVTGAEAYGLSSGGGPRRLPTLNAAEFGVDGLNPDRPHRLLFRHAGRKIAGSVMLSGTDAAPVTVVLRPTTTLIGRLVTAAGEPRAKVRVTAEYADASLWELSAIDRVLAAPVWTDAAGRFRIEGVAAELAVMILAMEKGAGGQIVAKEITLQPGEVHDLGDVRLQPFPKD